VRGCRQKHFRQTESRRNYRESHRGAADVCVPPPLSETRRVFLAPPALCTSKTNAQHRNVSSFAAVAAWRKQNEIWAPDENRSLDPLLNSLCSRQCLMLMASTKKTHGLYQADDRTPAELSTDSDDNLFECILPNSHHVLNHLLPDKINHEHNLRDRRHNRSLCVKAD